MAEDWSQQEVDIIVADYFSMLVKELSGEKLNKAEHRRSIQPLLNNRSRPSLEWKHMNISAALIKMGMPYIRGYVPAWNYQKTILESAIINYRLVHPELEALFSRFATDPVSITPTLNFETLQEKEPERSDVVQEPEVIYRNPVKVNYLEIEQANTLLGKSGEQIAFEFERWRLIHEGKDSLADKIEWVSQTQGDGLGYDILSRNNNGTDRYIEVKSTKLTKEAPIFFSRNEYDFAANNKSNYYLYRVFNLKTDPKLFMVNGGFDDFCNYQPVKFKGYF